MPGIRAPLTFASVKVMIKPQQRAYFEFTEDGTNRQHTPSRPQYTQPLSHTPRSFGNNHDDPAYRNNLEVYWIEREKDCNMVGCPHNHIC